MLAFELLSPRDHNVRHRERLDFSHESDVPSRVVYPFPHRCRNLNPKRRWSSCFAEGEGRKRDKTLQSCFLFNHKIQAISGSMEMTCETNPSLALDEEFLHLNVACSTDALLNLPQTSRIVYLLVPVGLLQSLVSVRSSAIQCPGPVSESDADFEPVGRWRKEVVDECRKISVETLVRWSVSPWRIDVYARRWSMTSDWNRRESHSEWIDDDRWIWLLSEKIVHRHWCTRNRTVHLPALASLRRKGENNAQACLSQKLSLAFEADFWLSKETILSASLVPAPSDDRSGDNFERLPLIDGGCCDAMDEVFFFRCPVVIESEDLTDSPLPTGEFSPCSLVGVVNVEEKWSKRRRRRRALEQRSRLVDERRRVIVSFWWRDE